MTDQSSCCSTSKDCCVADITRIEPGAFYSKAVIHGDTIYLSGVIPDEDTLDGDLTKQLASVLTKIEKTLTAVGSSKSKLLSANIYLSNFEEWGKLNESWILWIDSANKPARTTVEAKMKPKVRVEITVIAAK